MLFPGVLERARAGERATALCESAGGSATTWSSCQCLCPRPCHPETLTLIRVHGLGKSLSSGFLWFRRGLLLAYSFCKTAHYSISRSKPLQQQPRPSGPAVTTSPIPGSSSRDLTPRSLGPSPRLHQELLNQTGTCHGALSPQTGPYAS